METKTYDLTFITVDFWGKPIWQVNDMEFYVCSVDKILPDKEISVNGEPSEINAYFKEHPEYIVTLGSDIEDDAEGRRFKEHIRFNFID